MSPTKTKAPLVLVLLCMTFGYVPAKGEPPSRPSKAKTETECFEWGQAYQGYFDSIIVKARSSDQICKTNHKGSYSTIQSLCPNTSGGPVSHQNPCDEATKWTGCLWLGFQRGMQSCLSGLSNIQIGKPQPASKTQDVTLDEDDLAFLQTLAKQDEFIKKLGASSEGAENVGKLLGYAITGPAKLALQWDQALITGWRQANMAIANINKSVSCNNIAKHWVQTKALQFFNDLSKARGCNEL